MKNLKKTIQGFINSYANSGLKDIVESAIMSCSGKIIYRTVNRIVQTMLQKLVNLKLKNETETDPKKKEKRSTGIKLGGIFLRQVGESLIASSDVLLEGLE